MAGQSRAAGGRERGALSDAASRKHSDLRETAAALPKTGGSVTLPSARGFSSVRKALSWRPLAWERERSVVEGCTPLQKSLGLSC